MGQIQRVLAQAGRRLMLMSLIARGTAVLTVGLALLSLLVVVERSLGLAFPWPVIMYGIGAGCVMTTAVWTWLKRHKGVELARIVDARADLKESLSTALCVADHKDSWSQAAVQSAQERAQRVHVRSALPLEVPRLWPMPIAAAGVLAVLWLAMPNFDLTGMLARKNQETEKKQAIEQAKVEVSEKNEALKKMMERAGLEPDQSDEGSRDPFKLQGATASDIRRSALRKLTDVKDRAEQLKRGLKGKELKALKDSLRQLRQPGPGPLSEFSRDLARGNFSGAQKSLNDLAKKLSDQSLSSDEREQLKKQLQSLKEQMKKAAERSGAIEKALKDAGLDQDAAQQLARDPEALKKALEKMQGLSDEQKQKLMEMAQSQQMMSDQMESLAKTLGEMAEQMDSQAMSSEMMQAIADAGDKLSELEMMAMEMEALDALLDEALRQMSDLAGNPGSGGFSEFQEGDGRDFSMGGGGGGSGRGMGSTAPGEKSAFKTKRVKSPTKTGQGPIIGQRLTYGQQIQGVSTATFDQSVTTAAEAAADAIETMRVDPEYHQAIKHYFGRLKQQAKKKTGESKTDSNKKTKSEADSKDD